MASRLGSVATSSAASRSSHSLVTPTVLALSEASVPQCDAHLFDYLNIEMSQALLDSAAHAQAKLDARRALIEREFIDNFDLDLNAGGEGEPGAAVALDRQTAERSKAQAHDEALRTRLEGIGFKVGWALAERLAKERGPIAKQTQQPASLTTPQAAPPTLPLPLEPLEVVKFVCKDVWTTLYDKQIDNLRTNHRGVFVLQDNAFRPLLRLAVSNPGNPALREEGIRKGRQMLAMAAGTIRGGLGLLGISSVITVEYAGGAQCTFTIKTTAKAG